VDQENTQEQMPEEKHEQAQRAYERTQPKLPGTGKF